MILSTTRQVREQVADVDARVAVLGEPKRAFHHGPDFVGVHRVDHAREPLAIVTLERRLGVEHVDMARTPRHHELDHRARLRRKVRRLGLDIVIPLWNGLLGVSVGRAEVIRQKRRQRRAPEAGANVSDPLASRPRVPGVGSCHEAETFRGLSVIRFRNERSINIKEFRRIE